MDIRLLKKFSYSKIQFLETLKYDLNQFYSLPNVKISGFSGTKFPLGE